MRWFAAAAVLFALLGCAERYYRLTGPMPPPAIAQRCNDYAAEVEAKSDAKAPAGDRIDDEAGAQHGLNERNQDSDRARNAYAGCLARYGY